MIQRETLPERIQAIGELGFDGAEVCLEKKDWEVYTLTDKLAEEVKIATEEAGYAWYSLSFHQDYIYDDGKYEETKRVIPLVPKAGASILVFSGCRKKTGDLEEWRRKIERTKRLVEIAEDNGVVLAEEFEPNYIVGTTQELTRMFDEIDSESLCANLDVGHAFLSDPDPVASIRELKGKLVHCHIEGMGSGEHKHLLPWEGDMDVSNIINALREIGFAGGLALDLYRDDYEEISVECIRFLRKRTINN